MSEKMTIRHEKKLWFNGPNYTADAIIVTPDHDKIRLILRPTGEWALIGGFVDETDPSPLHAAIREASEEAGVTLEHDGAPLIYRGIVDDPRNSGEAWIETSAYLFVQSESSSAVAGDDAEAVDWFDLNDLPELYASHSQIIERALDHLQTLDHVKPILEQPPTSLIDAGHMEYDKYILPGDYSLFIKAHEPSRFSDPERAERSRTYLEKEAAIMAHLRQTGFTNLPARSVLRDNVLAMEALTPDNGWRWRAEQAHLDEYLRDAIETFSQLEKAPLHPDMFDIEPSYESFRKEGWSSFDATTSHTLTTLSESFMSRLYPESQLSALELISNLDDLRRVNTQLAPTKRYVFCHHDIRQSNLAWHQDHGTKVIDWSWAGLGEPRSDITSLLIDLHKSGHDISSYYEHINPKHCLNLIGFWLGHSTWPHRGDDTVRFQQFVSALSAYEILKAI